MRRRTLLKSAVGLGVGRLFAKPRLPIAAAVEFNMLPTDVAVADRFQMARDAGFEAIECPTTPSQAEAEAMGRAAQKAGIKIHSVMNMDHWKYPLSSADPEVVNKSLEGARTSLHNAHLWGAETVLIVPGVVDAKTSYGDAYTRSQESIRKLLPLAESLRVIVAVEEVWNKFLLSPLEFAKYVDSFQSPWLKAYFDVGNVVLYGYPQDWIRTLGPRIVKLHFKDFTFRRDPATKKNVADWVQLGDGDIDWAAIYSALSDIGYKGTGTVELNNGDPAYLKEVCRRFKSILAGETVRS